MADSIPQGETQSKRFTVCNTKHELYHLTTEM